jgi:hypothetical protein
MEHKNENQYLSLILDIAFCKFPCLYETKFRMKKTIIRITGNWFNETNSINCSVAKSKKTYFCIEYQI